MQQLCHDFRGSQHRRAIVFGLRTASAQAIAVGYLLPAEQDGRTLVVGGTGAEVRDWTDVRDVARLLARIAEQPQQKAFRVINGGSGRGTTVAEIAQMLVRHWGGNVAVRYSGIVRAGDPFSLVARCRGSPSIAVRLAGFGRKGSYGLYDMVQG